MIKAVIFDMDGTIIDSEPLSKIAWTFALNKHGYDMSEDMFKAHIGLNKKAAVALFQQQYGLDFKYAEVRKDTVAFRNDYIKKHGLSLKKGFDKLIDFLDEQKILAIVATSTPKQEAISHLTEAGVINRFVDVVGGDEVSNGKPAPDIFLEALRRLKLDAEECLLIEDSENGIRAGIDSGIKTICIPDLLLPKAEYLAEVYQQVETLEDVIKIVKNINKL